VYSPDPAPAVPAGTQGSCAAGTGGGGPNGYIKRVGGAIVSEGAPPATGFEYVAAVSVIRYRIEMEPVTNVPVLRRTAAGAAGTWDTIARGIEDLQIQYLSNGVWTAEPVAVVVDPSVPSDPKITIRTVTRRVRVLISARAVNAGNVTGQTTSAVGNAIRGQLISDITPRALETSAAKAGELM
jgi:hypothetical protein